MTAQNWPAGGLPLILEALIPFFGASGRFADRRASRVLSGRNDQVQAVRVGPRRAVPDQSCQGGTCQVPSRGLSAAGSGVARGAPAGRNPRRWARSAAGGPREAWAAPPCRSRRPCAPAGRGQPGQPRLPAESGRQRGVRLPRRRLGPAGACRGSRRLDLLLDGAGGQTRDQAIMSVQHRQSREGRVCHD